MREQIRIAVLSFTLALLAGFYFTVRLTGSVDLAFERMIIIVVLWMACALIWQALRILKKLRAPAVSDVSRQRRRRELTSGRLGSEH